MAANKDKSIKKEVGSSVIELVRGDITLEHADAIVNAANSALSPGGGVSGAIHRAAGPGLWEEAKKCGGCPTGEARLTGGHDLRARYVIHTVGPVYSGSPSDRRDLENCYKQSLKLASENGIKTICFPSISTGIFGYPVPEAAAAALGAIAGFLEEHQGIEQVRMVLFSDSDYRDYRQALEEMA